MPSIGVTKESIPFEGFGDITMVGKPEAFDPKKSKSNIVYSADAYTARAPKPIRVARKGAGKIFDEEIAKPLDEMGVYTSETSSNIWNLQGKSNTNESYYNQVNRFLEQNARPLFLKERGISLDDKSNEYELMKPFMESGEFDDWVSEKRDILFFLMEIQRSF